MRRYADVKSSLLTYERFERLRTDTNLMLAHYMQQAHYTWRQQAHIMNLTEGFKNSCQQKKKHCTRMRPDKYTSYGSDHGSGTPPCGKSHCNPYQNDKKRTRTQTSGKSRYHDHTNVNGKTWGPGHELKPVCSP